ncbi:MAG: hypothetical protein JEY96_14870 [Bacteroidales bacterium]|nr:hypothetical protein [Bacteroidales bacterium]
MKYFKVINHISSEVVVNTDYANYSTTLSKRKELERIIEFIVNSSEKLDLPLDMYFTLNNNLALWGEEYLNSFPNDGNSVYVLSDFLNLENSVYSKYSIKVSELAEIIQGIAKIGIEFFDEGFYLWEYLYERMRNHKIFPCRYDSLFLFDNKDDCKFYMQNHKGGGMICEVELINTKKIFKADMNLLDSIQNYNTYSEAKKIINKYWNGAKSNNPIFEYLFQGDCKLIPI